MSWTTLWWLGQHMHGHSFPPVVMTFCCAVWLTFWTTCCTDKLSHHSKTSAGFCTFMGPHSQQGNGPSPRCNRQAQPLTTSSQVGPTFGTHLSKQIGHADPKRALKAACIHRATSSTAKSMGHPLTRHVDQGISSSRQQQPQATSSTRTHRMRRMQCLAELAVRTKAVDCIFGIELSPNKFTMFVMRSFYG